MVETLEVPRGYEKYKQEFIRKLKRGEIKDVEESKKEELFYVA